MAAWDDLTDDDRAWALVPDLVKDPNLCPVCGGDKRVCQDPDAQHAWVVEARRCYRQRALLEYMDKRKDDPYKAALVVSLRVDDKRRKSAQQDKK